MRPLFSIAALTTAIVSVSAFSPVANAVTLDVSIASQNSADFTTLPTVTPNPAAVSTTGTVYQGVTGEVQGLYRSPYENVTSVGGGVLLSDGGYGLPGYDGKNYSFTSVEGGGSATYNFANGASGLTLLWGSPDSYNTLTFYTGLNGTGQSFSITGSALDIQTYGHDFVDFTSNEAFESVVFSSTTNAFEFGDLADAPATPLPATLPLFAGGLAGLGLLLYRRTRKHQALA
jgi:hypothetical protein